MEMENKGKTIRFYPATEDFFSVCGLLPFKENKGFERLGGQFVHEKISLLQRHPSGVYLSFETDSSCLSIRVRLSQGAYLANMSVYGQAGFDLYTYKGNRYIFLATSKMNSREYETVLFNGFSSELRKFRLYLPLYVPVNSLEIGIEEKAKLKKTKKESHELVVFYGTSITQGGCASRPGMSYTSILGRELNYEVINLGFSGNANLQPEMAETISKIKNMKYIIIEVEANAGDAGVLRERLEDFVKGIRKKHPNIHMILISHFPYSLALFDPNLKKRLQEDRDFQEQIAEKYLMHFLDGKKALSMLNYEETVDGVHLTDLGFYHLAMRLLKLINTIEKNKA